MNGRPNGDELAVATASERTWTALRANLKQELLAPVAALLPYSDMLLEEAEERGYEILLDDLRTVRAACLNVREVTDRILDAPQPLDEKLARHDLYNALNPIVQHCEVLIEDAQTRVFLEGFVPDLRAMLALATRLLQRIGDLFAFARPQAMVPEGEESAIAGLPPCLPTKMAHAVEKGLILVVDDNEINRGVLCRQLEREGHQTASAANGRIALQVIRERSFDLVLLDMLMPELGGFETLLQLKTEESLRPIPVIMITALDEIDSAARCIEHGAEDYLTKPCNTTLLRARIGACLEKKRLRDREARHLAEIQRGKERVDELLQVILPRQVVPELIGSGTVRPRRVENVAVLFADLVGFTRYCGRHTPEEVVDRLQSLIESWEEIALRHHILKIKTIGDAFMAACGLLDAAPHDPVYCAVRFGLEMIEATRRVTPDWSVRVGVHVGPVVAGVVGRRQYLFDLWGDTVNTAARMESNGKANAINLSPDAWARIADRARGVPNGAEVKGIGWTDMMLLDGFGSEGEGAKTVVPARPQEEYDQA
jgi:class 3 adenylate cyclase